MYICCICMRYVDTKNSVCCICIRRSDVHLLDIKQMHTYKG